MGRMVDCQIFVRQIYHTVETLYLVLEYDTMDRNSVMLEQIIELPVFHDIVNHVVIALIHAKI